MSEVELTIKGSIEALHLEPGDRIICTLAEDRFPGADFIRSLQEQLEEAFPGHECIVLSPGLSIRSLRQEGVEGGVGQT